MQTKPRQFRQLDIQIRSRPHRSRLYRLLSKNLTSVRAFFQRSARTVAENEYEYRMG